MNRMILTAGLLLVGATSPLEAQTTIEAGAEANVRATAVAEPTSKAAGVAEAVARAEGATRSETTHAATDARARIETAREALRRPSDRSPTDAEVRAGAQAIVSGAAASDLARIRESAPSNRRLEASLTALAELSATGADPARASAEIAALISAGASDRAIREGVAAMLDRAESDAFGGAAGSIDGSLGVDTGLGGLGAAAGLGASVVGGIGGL